MDIVIDLSAGEFSDSYFAPLQTMWLIIANGGWVILLASVLIGLWWAWITWRKNVYNASIKFVILAIDVPKENEQTPKAVENIFSHLHGIQKRGNKIARFIWGYNQQGFGLELISIGGYIQFLIRTPVQFRDMVEAAIYAQYPDSEITEVDDYTDQFKVQFPNEDYDIWGSEYKLTNNEAYPIKTYTAFEDPSTKETFKDPMASLLEILSRLKDGEQLWIQIVIAPPKNNKWRDKGVQIIKKLIGAKAVAKGKNIMWLPSHVIQGVTESLTASVVPPSELGATEADSKDVFRWPTMMQHLTPHERGMVEAIGIKISKIAFMSKIRIIYLAKKEVYDRGRIIPAVEGAIKQYNSLDLNGIKRDKKSKTKVTYPPIKAIINWRTNNRKRRLMWGYKYRSAIRGRNLYMLNIEELASLYHFPVATVKAPLVKKTEAKKSEPPFTLPTDILRLRKKTAPASVQEVGEPEIEDQAPENLPLA